ncbi:MAG: phage virion morphogenesis protein [Pseudomonadota bacterium]
MAGVSFEVDAPELATALQRLGVLPYLVRDHALELHERGAKVAEDAARRRIQHDKQSPDGEPWALWAAGRGQDVRPGQTLLSDSGDLLDNLTSHATRTSATVGNNLVYARIHQFGGDTSQGHPAIPARPYLGLSDGDREELTQALMDYLEQVL